MIAAFKALPFAGKLGIIVVILVIVGLIVASIRNMANEEREENNQFINQGVIQEREAIGAEVLNDVKEAADARNNPTDDDRRNVCTKYDRNCKTD
jgi:hypothetical protein